MFHARNIKPRAAYTDYTPAGPWADQTVVTRNADGVGFLYNAALNTLSIIPNKSYVTKDANHFSIINVPDPANNLDAANKEYVDTHGGTGGGIADAPSDGTLYGRENAAWVNAVPLAGGTMTGLLTLSADPTAALGAATKEYVDSSIVAGGGAPPPSTAIPGMDGTGSAGTAAAYSRGDHVHPSDTTRAPLASPAFTGSPTAPTPATGDSSTAIATSAFVKNQAYAPLASPTFTGAPAAPTPTAGNSSTQLATTAFVGTAVTNSTIAPSNSVPAMDGPGAAGSAAAYSRGDHVHPTDTSKAPLASPTFTGTPAAPTPATADSSTTIATTAFVKAQGYQVSNATITLSGDITGSGQISIATTLATVNSNIGTFQGLTLNAKGLVTNAVNMNYAPIASPTFTGTPAAPTPATGDSSTTLATTAFVKNQAYAPIASPTFTGTPAAPTATAGTATTQLATTAFVGTAITNAAVPGPATVAPLGDGTAAVGTSLLYTRQDHVHPTDTTRAPLASPTFTGTVTIPAGASIAGYAPLASPTFTGTPAAPTPAANDNTAKIATTAFVATSFAPLASPALTGTPTAPTAAVGTNTTQLATTAFVLANGGAVSIGVTPPSSPTAGQLWWESDTGILYIYYNDGTSSQWVVASPSVAGISDAPSDGNYYGRRNANWVNLGPQIKAAGRFNIAASTFAITIIDSYNVASITRSSAGVYAITFTTALADANYIVLATAQGDAASNNAWMQVATPPVPTTTSFTLGALTSASSTGDPRQVHFMVFE